MYRRPEPEIFFNVKNKFREPEDCLRWQNGRYMVRDWQPDFSGSEPGLAMCGVPFGGVLINISGVGGVPHWTHDDESNASDEIDGPEEFTSSDELSDSGEDQDDEGDDLGNSSFEGNE